MYDSLVQPETVQLDIIEGQIREIEAQSTGGKAFIGRQGMLFLVHDSNSFLDWQFGVRQWSEHDIARSAGCIRLRTERLRERSIDYRKFIVPEKSVVYSAYLPSNLGQYTKTARPALQLQHALAEVVRYGSSTEVFDIPEQTYFYGDTHPNWVGAYQIYRWIHKNLTQDQLLSDTALAASDLVPSLAGYKGDLFTQLNSDLLESYKQSFGFRLPGDICEFTIKLILKDTSRRAYEIEPPEAYKIWFKSRPTRCFAGPTHLPSCVIFRDSTSDFLVDYLAQHFSRSVFIWHGGQVVEDVIDSERPDIVVHIMAERFCWNYTTFAPQICISK